MKYQIDFTDNATGATSPIDVITGPAGYTAADYLNGCRENSDPEYITMIENGTITIIPIE